MISVVVILVKMITIIIIEGVEKMQSMEDTLTTWRKEEFNQALKMMEKAIEVLNTDKDIVKQGEAAKHFSISVNTLKDWVTQGAPEIRLDSGMPLYSKKAITEWLLSKQK
ncbi:predicted protein [Enterococcus faecium 1,231,501]|nr:predicted protein [Enterococcus faecium 1,231,501]